MEKNIIGKQLNVNIDMENNTKTLPLEDIFGVSKSWLEEKAKRC